MKSDVEFNGFFAVCRYGNVVGGVQLNWFFFGMKDMLAPVSTKKVSFVVLSVTKRRYCLW